MVEVRKAINVVIRAETLGSWDTVRCKRSWNSKIVAIYMPKACILTDNNNTLIVMLLC